MLLTTANAKSKQRRFFKDGLKLLQFNRKDEQLMCVRRPPPPLIIFNERFWQFRLNCIFLLYILRAAKNVQF